jgi:pyruvate formate lyase activating enzyme
MKLLVTNIQRFSIKDGPGIRTTVFIKGCSIKCPWCCNPENQLSYPEIFFNKKRCLRETENIDCKYCLSDISNPEEYLKINDKYDLDKYKIIFERCPTKSIGIYGQEISLDDLIAILNKDGHYFKKTGGGVTFSGGEPLLNDLSQWLEKLKKVTNYHICIESSLYNPFENLIKSIDFIDLFIIDIKILSREKAKQILKGDLDVFYKNIELLINRRKKDILFRFPVVDGYTNAEENVLLLICFIKKFDVRYLEIFSVHNLAKEKYLSLGREYKDFGMVKKEKLEKLKVEIEEKTVCKVNILEI